MYYQIMRPVPVSWANYWKASPTNRVPKDYTNSRGKWPEDDDRSYIIHDTDDEEARSLIAGIFLQALRDAQTNYRELVSGKATIDQYQARQWLNRNWTRDSIWLDFLDLDPVWFTKYVKVIKDMNWPQFRYDMRFITHARQQRKFVNGLLEAEEILSGYINGSAHREFELIDLAKNTRLHRTTMKEALVNLQCKGIVPLRFYLDRVVKHG